MKLALDLRFAIGARTLHSVLTTTSRRVAIVGPSGVGKTTLLRAMIGAGASAEGTLVLGERALHALPPEKRRIGWVPQEGALFPHLSVRENVAFGTTRPLARVLSLLAIDALSERMPAALSGGERQRVALARALATEPTLLLLDEPLSALDRMARAQIAQLIEEERARLDATLVLVSHDEADVTALADETYVLDASGALSAR